VDNPQPPPLRRVFLFWLPLAFTWLMMSVEGPFLAAVIARMADPKYNLAAFGVAFALAVLVEAPIIMIMSAATALVQDRSTYLKLRNFTNVLNLVVTIVMAVIVIPPIFDFISDTLLGLPREVATRTHIATVIFLPWGAAIGIRRFYQGVLIRHGQTRRVAYGTVVRLLAMVTTALGLYRFSALEGAWLGPAALSVAVIVEMVTSRIMVHRTVRRLLAASPPTESEGEPLTHRSIWLFYYPLALTTLLALSINPILTFFMAHGRDPIESLAVFPVVGALTFIFRAVGLAYQEVGIALIGDDFEGYTGLRTFATLLGVALVAVLALIAWTPLATVWFQSVSGLPEDLARFALAPTRILVIIPGLTVLLSFQRSMLVNLKATSAVTWATVAEVVVIIAVMVIGLFVLDGVGLVVAAAAVILGRATANAYLVAPLKRLMTQRLATYERPHV
jgi:hypothetical protein